MESTINKISSVTGVPGVSSNITCGNNDLLPTAYQLPVREISCVSRCNSNPVLAPEHRLDLEKSGLIDDTLLLARIQTVYPPSQITKTLGFDIPGLVSAYRIPFPPFEGYERYKLFYAPGCERGFDGKKKPKYIQRKGAPNRLYIPAPLWHSGIMQDISKTLYITEGEKKALKATQEGLPCIAVTGLWNWKKPGMTYDVLIDDFDLIEWQGKVIGEFNIDYKFRRKVCIVPDNDWLEPGKNLKLAVTRLCRKLQGRGARTFIVRLPGGTL